MGVHNGCELDVATIEDWLENWKDTKDVSLGYGMMFKGLLLRVRWVNDHGVLGLLIYHEVGVVIALSPGW